MTPIPLLPPALMEAPHIAPFDAIIRNDLGSDTDLTNTEAVWYYATVLNFDTCPASILPLLAVMFGVDGYKGFDYCTTEAQQRTTLKNSLLMKRRHGTVWAIQTALENAGYLNVTINDHLEVQFWDGSLLFDGTHLYDSNEWADFTIELQPPVGILPQNVNIPALFTLVNYWKRACTRCISITIQQLVITNFGLGNNQVAYWDGSLVFDGNNLFDGVKI